MVVCGILIVVFILSLSIFAHDIPTAVKITAYAEGPQIYTDYAPLPMFSEPELIGVFIEFEPATETEEKQKPYPEPLPLYELVSLGIFTLTAYCPCVLCTEIWSTEHPSRIGTDFVQKTASGTIPAQGRTIAVDTSVIDFGTVVVIDDHVFIAEDRGGAIRGNRIDVFFECYQEALIFGRRTAEVFIKNFN